MGVRTGFYSRLAAQSLTHCTSTHLELSGSDRVAMVRRLAMVIQVYNRRSNEITSLTKALLAVVAAGLILAAAIALLVVPFEPAGTMSQFVGAFIW